MVNRQAKSSEGRRLGIRLALAVLLANAAIVVSGATVAALAVSAHHPQGAVVAAPATGPGSAGDPSH
jgi:hypothetical protein